ncbi:MAG TPA: hypothetical protein PK228_10295 [Saprospiraceae bacterium]|nr:hypothetical protein [Saprospiraceae bacterium]
MPSIKISAEDLLAGANTTYELEIPISILKPDGEPIEQGSSTKDEKAVVELRPISLGTFQLITRAAKDDPGMIPLLMIKESCVQPQLSINQVKAMHLGLVEYLILHIRRISGLGEKKTS